MREHSISILSSSGYPLAISCRISPSRLIELLVYTYTTHNDSTEWKKDLLPSLCSSISLSLLRPDPLFFCFSLPFFLSLFFFYSPFEHPAFPTFIPHSVRALIFRGSFIRCSLFYVYVGPRQGIHEANEREDVPVFRN